MPNQASPNTPLWIWQQAQWPEFYWSDSTLQSKLRQVRLLQGQLLGQYSAANLTDTPETALDSLLENILSSSMIEGERLNAQSLRSSLATRLGLESESVAPVTDRSEGLADIMLDAVSNLDTQLSLTRLLHWHRRLFPTGSTSSYNHYNPRPGDLRGDEPMQVISGRLDRPKVHFEAPPRAVLESELQAFIDWFNRSATDVSLDPLLRAGLCHFWFITLHPFEDGNGRLARALTDLALAQAEQKSIRLYAMSATILQRRQDYYRILESSQRDQLDLSAWLLWFLDSLEHSLTAACDKIALTLANSRFWLQHQNVGINEAQRKVLKRLLEGGSDNFEQGINSSQYAKVAKVSQPTATRHLASLVASGCLEKRPGGGRNTRYQIKH